MEEKNSFINGSKWVRFDCHLHTKEDVEFDKNSYNNFFEEYIEKLNSEKIDVAIVTNHNKFNRHEFKQLKKKFKNGYLLAGVELNIKEGSNGIHTLIVFNEEWHKNRSDEDFINRFLNSVSEGQSNFATKNGKTNTDFIETIKKLETYKKNGRDYFIILAHVDNNSGFFNELKGGIIKHLGENRLFYENVISIQKSKTSKSREHLKKELSEVEGSDPKKIDEIGKGAKSYIKIGAFNFEAVKFALQDREYRVNSENKKNENSFIKSITFDGGKLDGQTINLSASMNNLVGIRGSGKSSIIEALRYGLDLSYGDNSVDIAYKNNLVKELLGSAGRVTIDIVDRDNREFKIKRVYGHSLEITRDNETINVNIQSILNKPLYFGQKDLSNYKDDFEDDLITKLIGDKTKDIQNKIEIKQQEIKILLQNIKKYDNLDDKKEEIKQKIEELNLKIEEFKKHKIEEKLQKQIEFNKDKSNFETIKRRLLAFSEDLNEFLAKYEKDNFFETLKSYHTKENSEIFDEYYTIIDETRDSFIEITIAIHKLLNNFNKIKSLENRFNDKIKQLSDEFLEIQRSINLPNLRADDFIKFTKSLDLEHLKLKEIEKSSQIKQELQIKLQHELIKLNELYRDEFKIIEAEINNINDTQDFIELQIEFKGNKNKLQEFLRMILSGSGLSTSDYQKLCEKPDCIEIYKQLDSFTFGGYKSSNFREKFLNSLDVALTYQVPNKIEIFYNGKELRKHSLGQRASALIVFILTQKENDIIIIDQPEDDLDNQTIYNEVIKELIKLKNQTQFIFATHNANIPILGDCEQIIICNYNENKINIKFGSIDNYTIQDKIINIMEGGKEAFDKRREIYILWKH